MRLTAIGLGCVLALGAAEIGLRLAGIGAPCLYAPDHFCGSRLRASTTGVWNREGHGRIQINANGFRGRELETKQAPHVFRVAVLGDSFMEALQVDEHATLCAQLQHLLHAGDSVQHRQYEVINCGVSGYGTAQELLMLRHHVMPLNPDAVLLAVYPENDVANNLRSLEQDPARPYFTVGSDGELHLDTSFRTSVPFVTAASSYERRKALLVNSSHVLQVLKQAKQSLVGSADTPSPPSSAEAVLHASVSHAIYTYSEPLEDEHREAWRITERLLEALADECASQEIPLFVFTVSSPVQVYPDPALRRRIAADCEIEDLFYSEGRFQAICASLAVPFYPLASDLQQVADESGAFLHGFRGSGLGLGHWNESGHSAAARMLADWLLQHDSFTLPKRGS